MIRIRFKEKKRGGWVYLTARNEAEAKRAIAGLRSMGYEVERL